MKVRLRIDGVDLSAYLPRKAWTLDDSEGKRISTLSLPLEDRTGALAASALELKDLILDDPDTGSRHFAGLVTQVETRPLEGVGLVHDVVCQEWGWLLDHYVYTGKFANQTDKAIIAAAFTGAGLTEVDSTTYVQAGRSVEKFVMNNMTLREMIDALAKITGFIWYVDWTKNLYYQAATASVASIVLSDTPDGATYRAYQNLGRIKDYEGLVNYVIVRGGYYLSAAKDVILGSNGVATIVPSGDISTGPTDAQTLPSVWRNTGSDVAPSWTAKTVGSKAKGQTLAMGYDVLFSWIDRTLEWAVAPPNLTLSYKLNGRAQQAYRLEIPDQAGIDLAGGRRLTTVINDEDVTTDQQAYDRAAALFREKAIAREKCVLSTQYDSLRSGQLVALVNAKMGISKYYSIRRKVTRFLGASLASHELTLTNPAQLPPDVVDMIAASYRAREAIIPYRDDEMLVVFLSYTETTPVALTEEVLEAFGTSKTYRCIANPVSHWPFEEGQGASAVDRYGGNTFTLYNSPAWTQGKKGYAQYFQGVNQYGVKSPPVGLSASYLTIAGWLKIYSLADYRMILHHNGDVNGGWSFYVAANGTIYFLVFSGGSAYIASKAGLVAGTWYHVAAVYDGANVKVYVDGVAGTDAALVGAALKTDGTLQLGRDELGGGENYLYGLLDDFWLFPVALSQTEIQRLRDFKEINAGFWKVAA